MKTQFGEMITGDFSENTITFEISKESEMVLQAGKYAIVPISEYEKLVNVDAKQEKALPVKNNSKSDCPDCWGSGWETQFVKSCVKCNGTGKAK